MNRVLSVDILRGLTIVLMIMVNNPGNWGKVYAPLLHADWHGLTPTDLVFPFFLFIVGISISLAYHQKKLTQNTLKKIVVRTLKLIGLGLFLNWFLPYFPFFKNWDAVRFPGVLQRIGIVFLITSILYLLLKKWQLWFLGVFILIGYYLFLGFVPFSDGTMPVFDRAPNNWANFIDLKVLGSHMWKSDYDPEGLLSTLPAIVSSLLGVFVGEILKIKNPQMAIKKLFVYGSVFLLLGYVWNPFFPINKAIWTSSFVLVTAGWASLVLVVVYYFVDVKQLTKASIFRFVGMNAITIFFLSSFIAKCFYLIKLPNGRSVHGYLYNTLYVGLLNDTKLASFFYSLTVIAFYVFLAYVLHKKKIYIKV